MTEQDEAASRRIDRLFRQKLEARYPDHPWVLKWRRDEEGAKRLLAILKGEEETEGDERSSTMPVTSRDLHSPRPERAAPRQSPPAHEEPAETTLWGVLWDILARVPWLRLLAVVIWGAGLWCTKLSAELFFDDRAAQWIATIIAQSALTALESPLWRRWAWDGHEEYKRPYGLWNGVALLFDGLLNITGTSQFVARAHELPFVGAIVRLLSGADAGPVAPLTGLPALLLAALLAGLLSAAPELLWWAE